MTETNKAEYWAVHRITLSNEVKRARADTATGWPVTFCLYQLLPWNVSTSCYQFARDLRVRTMTLGQASDSPEHTLFAETPWQRDINSPRYWRIMANEAARIERANGIVKSPHPDPLPEGEGEERTHGSYSTLDEME